MHAIEALLSRPEVDRLGWVLLHFLWQGAIGAALLAFALFALRRASANARYLTACAMLVAMAACLPVTWLVVPQRSSVDRPAMTTTESVGLLSKLVAIESIPQNDGGSFIERPGKPLDELLAKRPLQTEPVIDAEPAVAVAPSVTWQQRIAITLPWLAVVWLGGVLILSLRLAIGWSAVRRLRRAASQPADDSRQAVLLRLSQQLGIRWPVKLLESALVEVPTMIGWLRPAILWPPSVLAGLSVEQFESLLAHELAHVRRHDYLVNLAQTAIETLLFYHPAVWWVSNRIRQERECCCDDLAIATCGNRISYARALTALEELRPRPRQFALAADGGRLLLRIRRIVGLPAPRNSGSRHWLLGIALSGTALALIAALGVSNFATGDEPAKQPADSHPSVNPAEKVKRAELPKTREIQPHLPFDLIVQKLGNSDANNLLPEELGDRIKQIPHVTLVTPLLDESLHTFGLPPDSADFKGLNILSGTLPTAGDHQQVVVGKVMADKLGYKIGDKIKVYGNDVQVIGIFESPFDSLNDSVQMPLADMQKFMHAEHRVTEFLVRVDISTDKLPEHQAQLTELRKQIEALGYAAHCEITAIEANPSEKPPVKSKIRDERPLHPSLELDGRVVDDETGKPIAAFHRQIGRFEQNGVTWGFSEITGPPVTDGYFKAFLNWEAGERIRIIAGGYVPQLVLAERPKAGAKTIEGIVVRMKRGRQVSGRVFDNAGSPVAGASAFVVGAFGGVSQIKISGGKAMMADRDGGWTEDDSITQFATDAEGKFTVTGIGWDAKYIAVSCPALDLWIVPAPTASEPQNGFEIRLPQPGKLVMHYDIAGATDAADIAVWPSVDNLPYGGGRGPMGPGLYVRRDQQGRPLGNVGEVLHGHNVVIRQHGELVFDNLPPGEYTVARTKHIGFRFDDTMIALGRRVVKVISGKTTVTDFVRDKGAQVAGQVVGLDRDEVVSAKPYATIVTVQSSADADDSIKSRIDEVVLAATDKDGKPADGKFASERLMPGQYRIRARVFDYDAWERSRDGWKQYFASESFPPIFVGETLVTVPENGAPPPVEIELHKFEKPAPISAPAKGKPSAPAKQAKAADLSRPISKSPYKIQTLDCLSINVAATLPGKPIVASYTVEPGGTVDLGPSYGRVKVEGLTLEEAAGAIYQKVNIVLKAPQVSVTLAASGAQPPVKIKLQNFEKPVADHAVDPAKQGVESPAKAPQNPALLTRVISGHAVDAETGKPVQGFIYEEATYDERDPKRFYWNGDAIGPGSQRDGEFGIVVKNQPGRPLWARIVAPGYVPQPITEKPIVLADDTVLDKLVVKMHRGKELAGRVVDSAGKPVVDAGVYLLRNQGRRQVVRDSAVAGPNQQYEMLAITHAATDADGRFKLTGSDAESGRVAVLSGEMNLWVTAIPADPADWTIHLPHPATIECQVDDDRGERDTFYDLDFVTAGRKGWEMLRAYQFSLRSKDGRLVGASHTPGQYQLTRRRRVAVGDYEGEFRLADVKLQVNPADTFTIDLRRPIGWPIAGQVVGLKELGLSGAVISVEPPGEVKRGAMTFDALTCGEDGRFETGRIPPGRYRAHVDAYLPKKPADPRIFGGGLDLPLSARLPDFTADAEVTIAKDEQPAKLKLELKKGGESRAFRELMQYHEQPHPAVIDEFTAPPWAAAAPNKNPAETPKPVEHSISVAHGDAAGSRFDLVVQKSFARSGSNDLLSEELGERIKKLPHVAAVTGELFDYTGIDYALNASVRLIGVPADSPVLESWKLNSGRLLKTGDRHCVLVGNKLAEKFSWEVGTSIKLYDTAVTIIGIYQSRYAAESDAIAMLLTDMQESRKLPHQVQSLFIRADIPKDGSREYQAQVANLAKQIEALGEGVIATIVSDEPANKERPPDSQPNDTPVEKLKLDNRSLVVQKAGKYPELNISLPEELGDRIKAIPHVKAVSASLMDVVSFPEHQLAAVVIGGLPPDSPLFAEWTLKAGRLPKAGDHAKVVVGMELAKNMKVNVTDKIKIYDADVEIIGIFESKNVFENGSIATLLTDLQKFMDRPKQVTGFLVRTDVSREDPPENRALIAELRKRIEALGDGVAAIEKPSEIHRDMSKAYERTRFGDQSKSPLTLVAAQAEAPKPEAKPIEVHGQVIDDATGKPITLFDQQGGHADPKDATKITWGYYLRPNAGGAEGRFDANIDWSTGWRARIIASGYVPQPILTESPKAGQATIDGLVLRMKRGREVSGRVLDHVGKPVKDASLFIVGSRPVEITGGKALMNSSHGFVEDSSAVRYSTDGDGRFTLAGIGEDAKSIAVSCGAVDLWIVPAPSADEAAKGFEIRLPEPGKLFVHYDIPGGAEEATIFLQLHTWDREGWRGVDNRRHPTVKQHGELVLDNMPPGLYEVVRNSGGFLDRRQVTIEPGKTITTDFIRKTGAPITGRVVGLDREDVQKAKPTRISVSVHKPGDERNPVAPKFASVGIDPFDKDGKPSDGSFKTEIIPPGEYLVRASVFIKERPERRYRTGIIPPGFEGEALVTVPEQGAPPPVEIQLKKWVYQPFEFKKTEPPPMPELPKPETSKQQAPNSETPKSETPKQSPRQDAYDSAFKRGLNSLAEPLADKGVDDAVKQGLQAIGNKQNDDEASRASVTKALLYLARKEAQEAAGAKAPDEVVTKIDPTLAAGLLALDAMRGGTNTPIDKVDEAGRKLLEKYQKPEEQGQIYFKLLQMHGDSGLQTPNRIISYAQEALKYPLGSRHELRVYIYWGDTLNVQKTEKPLPEQRKEAAAVYLKGLKLAWMYPETPPAVPDPPPRYDGPEGPEQSARQKAWERYRDLRNKADFIKEVNYDRAIFIRQIADMYYHRPPAAAATPAEIDALRKQAAEILQNDAAVARLMAAINPDPDAVHVGNAALPAFDINSKTTPADAVRFGNTALPADAPKEEAPKEDPKQTPLKESTKQEAYDSAFKRGLNSLAEPPADKGFDDAVKQGLQAIGQKPGGDEATNEAIKKGLEYLARKQAEEATASQHVPNEVTIKIDPALSAELQALDAMRAGTSTPFDKVDEIGRKLLDRYPKPEEQGQIYYALLQVHGQSGLVTPEHIIEYSKQALKYPLGSRQELMVYIYWGDTLNVRKTEKPWPEQRREAAEVYLKGLKLVWAYHAPEQPPELPDPPPLYDGPEGPEQAARQKAMEHYMVLRNKADFIKELIYHRHIFIRQIADMYHRRGATPAEIEELRRLASDMLANKSAVARLMAAVETDSKKAAEQTNGGLTKLAIDANDGAVRLRSADGELRANTIYIYGGKGSNGEWSKPVGGIEARLSFERGGDFKGAPAICTFLELRNVSGKADPLEIPLDPTKIEFKVTDAAGKDVPIKFLDAGVSISHRALLLPADSQLRFSLRGSIDDAVTFKDRVTVLSLASGAACVFQRGDTGEYTLHAKFTIPKADNGDWHGTIELPPVRVPLAK